MPVSQGEGHGLEDQGHSQTPNELEASLGYVPVAQKTATTNKFPSPSMVPGGHKGHDLNSELPSPEQ